MAKNLTGIKQTRTLKLFRETEYGDDEEGLSDQALPGVSAGHPGTQAVVSGLDFTLRAMGSHCRVSSGKKRDLTDAWLLCGAWTGREGMGSAWALGGN